MITLTKPFAFPSCWLRIQALIRRATRGAGAYSPGGWGSHAGPALPRGAALGREDRAAAARVRLCWSYLMRHANRPVTKTMILNTSF
jgi:DNA-binding response OmpR family regulator